MYSTIRSINNRFSSFSASSLLVLTLCLAGLPSQGWTADPLQPMEDLSAGAELPVLPLVDVVATPVDYATGLHSLDRNVINSLPIGGSTTNDLLTILPGIQTGENRNSSLLGGEILPPDISISGGKIYQNNFRIDGMGNGNLVDPLAADPSSATLLPGHTQEIFLSPNLVDRITVYDSNIPAKYGDFTGGVVDIATRKPGPEVGGSLSYQTTRSSWTEQFVAEKDLQSFEDSNSWLRQPRFEKHEAGATLNLPLGPDSGLLASYQQIFSRIPLSNLNQSQNQYRRNENFFLKLGGAPSVDSYRAATLIWAPYEEKLFRPDTQNGDFSIRGGGFRLGGESEERLSFGTWSLSGGYRQSRNEREAPSNLYAWNAKSATKDWGQLVGSKYSYEGGLGDLETVQKTAELHTDLELKVMKSGTVTHQVQIGFDGERIHALYDRPETTYVYFPVTSLTPTVVCAPGAIDCIDGEQYFSTRQVFAATRLSTNLTRLATYAEDRIVRGRVELRPGLRLSYDDFMENLDLAPRLAFSWDLLGDGRSAVIGGLNRYYGTTLVAYKLREAFSPFTPTESRSLDPTTNIPGPWEPKSEGTSGYKYSGLDTPYSDEWTLGLRQLVYGGTFDFRYVQRHGHDEFARARGSADADGVRNYTLTNNGSSRYQSARLSWERFWAQHYLLLDGTWQDLKTNAENYNATLALEDLQKVVFYNGELLHLSDLPATDYNRPWIANLTYIGRLPGGFSFSNITRFRSAYRALGDTRKNTDDGIDIYGEVKQPSSLTFDWAVAWAMSVVHPTQLLTLTLKVNNVFNRRIHVGNSSDEYELGRQFWAGVEYTF